MKSLFRVHRPYYTATPKLVTQLSPAKQIESSNAVCDAISDSIVVKISNADIESDVEAEPDVGFVIKEDEIGSQHDERRWVLRQMPLNSVLPFIKYPNEAR
jgi:hypothetical protein